MIRVLQVTPEIGPGTGVGSVAFHLEREWAARGIPTARFTMAEARGAWLPAAGAPGLRGRLIVATRVVWFSTVGTVLARRAAKRQAPGTVVICHNDALAGDVYVNHGIVLQAMRNRGGAFARVLRNPLHPFTITRDLMRYRSRRIHQVVVNLTSTDAAALQHTYGRVRPRSVVIGNGVDTDRFRPPTEQERSVARARLAIPPDQPAVLFVGHEFGRKGLPELVDAIAGLVAPVHLVVVGGTPDLIADIARHPAAKSLGARLHLLGPLADPLWVFHGADVFVLASAYEAYPLVVLEALATGLPVVATPVGPVPDLVVNGHNGQIVDRTPEAIRAGIDRVLSGDPAGLAEAARATALEHTWGAVADRYLVLLRELAQVSPPKRGNEPDGAGR